MLANIIFLLGVTWVALNNFYGWTTNKTIQEQLWVTPPKYIEHTAFGYHEIMADSLWLRYVQNIDFCAPKGMRCHMGWAYRYLDAVTSLAPKFRLAYSLGAPSLTVLSTDVEGSRLLFEKGLKNFPKDWIILYRASYLYLYEARDPKRAAELLYRAGQNGAPYWVKSLSARLYTEAGQKELAIQVLENYLQQLKDPAHKKKVQERLQKLRGP